MSVTSTHPKVTQVKEKTEQVLVRVLYVAGYGRSGSTLLGDLWAQECNVQHLGELSNIGSHEFWNRARCSCGETPCEFWEAIRSKVNALPTVPLWSRSKCLTGLPGLLIPGFALKHIVHRIPAGAAFPGHSLPQLTQVIAEECGGTFVDSSKTTFGSANRPRVFKCAGFDVEVRTAVAPYRRVLNSYNAALGRRNAKPKSTTPIKVAISRRLALFAAAFQAFSLGQPSKKYQLDALITEFNREDRKRTSTQHTIAGNRHRLSGSTKTESA